MHTRHPRSRHKGHRILNAVGYVLVVLCFASLLLWSFNTGQIGWLNAYKQPVTIYGFMSVLVVAAVVYAVRAYRWFRQRNGSRSSGRGAN